MAFPTTSVLDNFNRANGALGSNWTNEAYGSADGSVAGVINTNQAQAGTGGYTDTFWNASTFDRSNGIEVYATLGALPATSASNGMWVEALQQADPVNATADGYQAEVKFAATHTVKLWKYTNAAPAQLVASTNLAGNLVVGDKLGLELTAAGAVTLYTFQSGAWTSRLTTTDNAFTGTGFTIGWAMFDSARATRLDDFGGGQTVIAGAAAFRPPRRAIRPSVARQSRAAFN